MEEDIKLKVVDSNMINTMTSSSIFKETVEETINTIEEDHRTRDKISNSINLEVATTDIKINIITTTQVDIIIELTFRVY